MTISHADHDPGVGRRLQIRPASLRLAEDFVREHHRHSAPRSIGRFAVQVRDGERLVGVALAGRPNSRHLDDGLTIEVLRVCTDGTPNACSKLYGAVHRTARAMGYERTITYTLASEPGASVRAVGYRFEADVKPDDGNRPSRPRTPRPAVPRVRWGRTL